MAKDSNKSKVPKEKAVKSKKKIKASKKKPSKLKRFFKYFFLTILILGLLISVVGIGYVVAVIKTTPSLDVNAIYNLNNHQCYMMIKVILLMIYLQRKLDILFLMMKCLKI